jgi:hypothetical protein
MASRLATPRHYPNMHILLDLQLRFVHVPHEQHEPLDGIHMVDHADLFINGVNVAKSAVGFVVARAEAEDVLSQVPVVACVGVACHDAGCDDDVFTVDCPHSASKDSVRRDNVDVSRCHGRHGESVGRL